MNKLAEAMMKIEKLSVIEGFFKPSDYYEAEGAKKCLSILRNAFSGGAWADVKSPYGKDTSFCALLDEDDSCKLTSQKCPCKFIGDHADCPAYVEEEGRNEKT